MDMTKHLKKWLNDQVLREQFGDEFEDQIADVTEQVIRNRFTAPLQVEPVITFASGWKLIPNISQRRALCEFWGPETDDWVGRRLQVYRFRKERIDDATGLVRTTWEKRVRLPVSELERAI
jgi:hypothetical protein